MGCLWEEVENFGAFDDEFRGSTLLGHGEGQLQQIVLNGSRIAGHVNQIV